MRIIHTGDLHLESSLIKLTPDQVRERKEELFAAFLRMVDEAVRLSCRALIIAGDLFDTDRVSKRSVERVISVIEKHPEIDFLYLKGNHEGDAFIKKVNTPPSNLKYFGDEWTYFTYGDVIIAGRGVNTPTMFRELSLSPDNKNIVVLHGALRDYSGAKDGISLPDAMHLGIGYMALGHYHSYSATKIDNRSDAVYCGTPEGRGFDEAGEHGFVVIDTDTSPISHRFIKSAKREVKIIELDVSECERRIDIDDKLASSLGAASILDLVRVVLVGKRSPELTIDLAALSIRWKNKFYYFEIKDETGLRIDPMSYIYDKSLKGEFIRLVYSRTDIRDEMKEKIIRCGIAALLGEDTGI